MFFPKVLNAKQGNGMHLFRVFGMTRPCFRTLTCLAQSEHSTAGPYGWTNMVIGAVSITKAFDKVDNTSTVLKFTGLWNNPKRTYLF